MMTDTQPMNEKRLSLLDSLRQCTGTAADRRNRYRFLVATMVWALSVGGATRLLESREDPVQGLAWIIPLAPSVLALVVLAAYLRFLRDTDEFVRRIQIEALAIGFGGSVLFATGYQVLQSAGAPTLETSTLVALMMVIWVIGQLVAAWRYR